ncbi:methyltransferase [Paracoccaceae bacterium Fryx2]|nr:methyltransferase [Paracoccaceae bacterium Fryx2]
MFAPDDLTDDAFLGGRLRLWQPRRGYRAAADPVLLAAAVTARPGQSVLDLGCGAGTAVLCLGARVPGLVLAGIELQPAYADLARRNAARNAMALEVGTGDIAALPAALRRGFDHVIANPPFYAPGGSPSPDAGRDTALRQQVSLALWVEVAARRLNPGGWMTLIVATAALPQVLAALPDSVGSAAVLPVAARQGRPATRVILQARKGGRAPFRLLAPFILHAGATHDGDRDSHTPEASAVLRGSGDLSAQFG